MRNSFPRKILMTADTIGGVWTYAMELARALEPHGVVIVLATMGAPVSEAQRRESARLKNLTLIESNYKLEWMDAPWRDVDRAGDWLLEIASRFQPDVVHLNGYSHGTLPWDAPVVIVAHSCVLSWWSAVKREPAPPSCDEYRERVRAGLAAADLVIAPTISMLNSLVENYGASALNGDALPSPNLPNAWTTAELRPPHFQRTRVIPNSRDPQLFSPEKKQPCILAAGRAWDEAKNFASLDAAAPSVKWAVRLAGDCTHPNGSPMCLENVFCLGKLPADEVAKRLATASIYALPARYEPFGLSILEAALCGCALVLGDIASLRENWSDVAVLVTPDDATILASALNDLIEDEPRRDELGRLARARALEFSPQKMAENYLAAYRECAISNEQQPAEAAA